jgi:hypothetical protein
MPTEVSPNEHIMREPGSLQLDPSGEGVAIDETKRLIASNKVEGTPVYRRLGNVYNFMVDKYTGQVAYAVMSFGGFLGLGESYHPLPWKVLSYDTRLEGYVIDLDRERLKNAPRYGVGEEPFADPAFGQLLGDYYAARRASRKVGNERARGALRAGVQLHSMSGSNSTGFLDPPSGASGVA